MTIENIDRCYPSTYLKAEDLQGKPVKVTIAGVKMNHDLEKPEVAFKGTDKTFTLNITNKNSIKKMFGVNTQNWVGREIVLFPTTTDYKGDQVACIRIRPATNGAAAQAPVEAENPAQGMGEYIDDEIPF